MLLNIGANGWHCWSSVRPLFISSREIAGCVSGGVKLDENRRFEIPFSSF